jgi:hypothetical protein
LVSSNVAAMTGTRWLGSTTQGILVVEYR